MYTSPHKFTLFTNYINHQITTSYNSPNHQIYIIHQVSPMHIITNSHSQVWHISPISSACNVLDTSTCMWYEVLDSEIILPRFHTHVKVHLQLGISPKQCKSTPPFTFFIKSRHDYECMDFKQRFDNAHITKLHYIIFTII
jgi:hypothetical protein